MSSLLLVIALGVGLAAPAPAAVQAATRKDQPDAGVVVKKKDKKKDHGTRAEEE